MKKTYLIFIGVIFCLLLFGYISYVKNLKTPAAKTDKVLSFEIKQGEGVREIVKNLEDKDLVKHSTTFLIYLKLNGLSSKVKAGDYTLNKKMTIIEIVEIITQGKTTTSQFTIPEGWTLDDIATHLDKKGIVKRQDFLDATKNEYNYDFLDEANSLEGYLFPDTYIVQKNISATDVIKKMLVNFENKLDLKLRSQISKKGKSVKDIVTLASIIEKEVPTDKDRAVVSGIFYKRMEIGMALEADSTINFVTKKSSPSVSLEDLNVDSPYNTYRNKDLPPGAICSPGLSAIKAAINPKESPYLYYLSRQDTLETIFSTTLDEHIANQRKYLE